MVSDSCAVVAVGGQRRLCLFRVSRAAVSVFCILAFDFFFVFKCFEDRFVLHFYDRTILHTSRTKFAERYGGVGNSRVWKSLSLQTNDSQL